MSFAKLVQMSKQLLTALVIGLTLISLLYRSDVILVSSVLELILSGFDRILSFLAIFEALFSLITFNFGIPLPDEIWRYIFVCSIFLHARAFFVEWEIGGQRRKDGIFTFLVSFTLALVGSYFIGHLDIEGTGIAPMIFVVLLLLLMEAVRNTLSAILRVPEGATIKENMIYYHKNWTLGYFVMHILSIFVTYILFNGLIDSISAIGFFVLYLFVAIYLVCHFLAGYIKWRTKYSFHDYYTKYRGRIDLARVVISGLFSAISIMVVDAFFRGGLTSLLSAA